MGGTSCPARAELPEEQEDPIPFSVKRFPGALWGGVVWDGCGDSRASGPLSVLGAMVSLSMGPGVTTREEGPGGQSSKGSRSSSELGWRGAGAVG